MKKLMVYILFSLICISCNTNYGNAVNNTTADSLQRVEIYNKNAGNLNSINVSAIQKQIIIEDTTELNNIEFIKYCKLNTFLLVTFFAILQSIGFNRPSLNVLYLPTISSSSSRE